MSEIKTSVSWQLDVDKLRCFLDTQFFGIGDRLVFLPTVDSTNTLAMHLALDGSEEGVVVLTDSQTAGKGRLGRRWVDLAGLNALSSIVLRPLFPPYFLVMAASLAVVDAITDSCGVVSSIKWPNDVLIGSRKVAGILIETSHDHSGRLVAIVGIGVNVNGRIDQFVQHTPAALQSEPDLRSKATTLATECGHPVNREHFIAYLLRRLESLYLALQQEALESAALSSGTTSRLMREQWRNQLSTLGRSITVQQGNTFLSGVAEDVDDNGELLLRLHSGEHTSISWGDVGYLPS